MLMYENFKIVKVDYKYCDYLRQFDLRVPYNAGKKELDLLLVFYLWLKNVNILHL